MVKKIAFSCLILSGKLFGGDPLSLPCVYMAANPSLEATITLNANAMPTSVSYREHVDTLDGSINDHAHSLRALQTSSGMLCQDVQKTYHEIAVQEVRAIHTKVEMTEPKYLGEIIQTIKEDIKHYEQKLQNDDVGYLDLTSQQQAVLGGFHNALHKAEAKLQNYKAQQLDRTIVKAAKHKMQHNVHKQEHYAKKLAEAKSELLSEFKMKHANDSLNDLRSVHKETQDRLAEQKAIAQNQTKVVGRAGEDALKPRVELACTKFNIEVEKGKQEILEGLIQKKTFTPEYKSNLTSLQQNLESKQQLSERESNHLFAVKKTLETDGAVAKLDVSCSPEVIDLLRTNGIDAERYTDFVGNAFENQLVKENLDNFAVASDLKLRSYSDQPFGDYADAIVHFGDSAVTVLSKDPGLAHQLTNIGSALREVAEGLAKGVVEGAVDALKSNVDLIAHPVESIKGFGNLVGCVADFSAQAVKAAVGDRAAIDSMNKTVASMNAAIEEFVNQPLEAQVEGLSRFATTMLVPAPGKLLAKIPGVTKGINALDKIAKHELNALRAATKTAKTEIVVLNGVKVSKPIAEQIETLQKGAGRILSSEETLNTARNLEGQLAHKAPVTSAFAKGVENCSQKGVLQKNPLEKIKFTDKVKNQMHQVDYHGFPKSVEAFGSEGIVSKIRGGDGIMRTKIEIKGSYLGKEGVFEYIVESDGVSCNHRLFKPLLN